MFGRFTPTLFLIWYLFCRPSATICSPPKSKHLTYWFCEASEGEIGEGFEWVWVFCLICWGCFQVWFLLIFGLIFVEFGFFVGWVWILLILALIFYWICGWIFMCFKMVVVGCISWVVVGRWLICSTNEERAHEMKKKKKREEEGI